MNERANFGPQAAARSITRVAGDLMNRPLRRSKPTIRNYHCYERCCQQQDKLSETDRRLNREIERSIKLFRSRIKAYVVARRDCVRLQKTTLPADDI